MSEKPLKSLQAPTIHPKTSSKLCKIDPAYMNVTNARQTITGAPYFFVSLVETHPTFAPITIGKLLPYVVCDVIREKCGKYQRERERERSLNLFRGD